MPTSPQTKKKRKHAGHDYITLHEPYASCTMAMQITIQTVVDRTPSSDIAIISGACVFVA